MPSRGYTRDNLAQIRAERAALLAAAPPSPITEVERTEQHIPGQDGAPDVRVLVYTPPTPATGRAGFLHIHGGGYLFGTPEMTDDRNGLATA